MASNKSLNRTAEKKNFDQTFELLEAALGKFAFKRWDGAKFTGKFLISLFEVVAIGVSLNLEALKKMGAAKNKSFIIRQAKSLWTDEAFKEISAGGVRGTSRLAKLIPLATQKFKP